MDIGVAVVMGQAGDEVDSEASLVALEAEVDAVAVPALESLLIKEEPVSPVEYYAALIKEGDFPRSVIVRSPADPLMEVEAGDPQSAPVLQPALLLDEVSEPAWVKPRVLMRTDDDVVGGSADAIIQGLSYGRPLTLGVIQLYKFDFLGQIGEERLFKDLRVMVRCHNGYLGEVQGFVQRGPELVKAKSYPLEVVGEVPEQMVGQLLGDLGRIAIDEPQAQGVEAQSPGSLLESDLHFFFLFLITIPVMSVPTPPNNR